MNKLASLFLFIATISLINCELCARLGRHILQHQCVLTPEGTEGPYYLPYHLVRSDIRENRPGLQFKLKFKVTDITKCEPMKNVTIDIWQADALGTYSSYTKNLPTTVPKSVLHADPTDNTTFLRGVQITDDNGEVEFMTVFPGQYAFRTPHIHLQAHVNGTTVHVAQLYFENSLNNRMARLTPYKQRVNKEIRNEDDYIFRRDNGDATIIHNIKPLDGKRLSRGLNGEMIIGIDPSHESSSALHGRQE
ncbi:hypothetical protein DERP_009812 [Dermatophagoides pteronyssinus]|uniref:Intradiol ring-cleavage dioxygenases domain-containing protein n=1 Tax=Dermatophagoides pteronyssinus TaxID=6956 RepID=A0ABQ8IRZ5_DERPT|nr:hypothetical protein DERP_009812 [Dermatophagoides pteronyssinus]